MCCSCVKEEEEEALKQAGIEVWVMVSKINWLVPQKSEAPIFLQLPLDDTRTRNLSSAEVSILGLVLRRELTDIAGFLIFHNLRGGLTLVYSIQWLNYFELNVCLDGG